MTHLKTKILFLLIVPLILQAMDTPLPDPSATAEQRNRYEQRRDEFRFNPGDEKKAEAEFGMGAEVHITNFRNPVIINDRLRTRGADPRDEENDAKREGELRFMQQKELQRLAGEYAASPEGKKIKRDAITAAVELEREIKDSELDHSLSDAGKRTMQKEVDITAERQRLLKAAAVNQQLNLQNINLEKRVIDRNIELAVYQQEAQQRAQFFSLWGHLGRAREYLFIAQQVAPLISQLSNKVFVNLPFSYCRKLKQQQEVALLEAEELHFKKLEELWNKIACNEKDGRQASLERDWNLNKKGEENIKYFKKLFTEATDPQEKETYQKIITSLQEQQIENRLKLAALNQLNLNNQPHFKKLLAEERAKMKTKQSSADKNQPSQAARA